MKSTKRSLFTSALSLVICISMLLGTTFAWFTDTVESGVNKIVAGNLDIEVEYINDTVNTWKDLQGSDTVFSKGLWEPGHTEFVTLKITNKGTLALKYRMNVSPINEKGGINVAGENFKLSDYLVFGTTAPATEQVSYTRATAREAVGTAMGLNQNALTKNSTLQANGIEYITLVVYMPESVGNAANYKTGTTAPEIELGIKFIATQLETENDSFGPDYDQNANHTPESTVLLYNYFPQTKQVASLAKDGEGKAVLVGGANPNLSIVDGVLTLVSDAKINNDLNKPYVSVSISDSDINWGESTYTTMNLNVRQKENGAFAVDNGTESVTYDVSVSFTNDAVALTDGKLYTVKLFIGEGKQGLTMKHEGTDMTEVVSLADVVSADQFFYDEESGYLTMKVAHFSEFPMVYNQPEAAIGTRAYYSFAQAAKAAEANGGDTVSLLRNIEAEMTVAKIKLDMNGKTMEKLTVTKEANIVDNSRSNTGDIKELVLKEKAVAEVADDVSTEKISGDGDVIYSDIPDDPEVLAEKYNATAGGTAFTNLQTAFKVVEDGQKITLLNNMEETKELTFSGKNVALDLGGKTLTLSGNHDGIVLEEGANLTVANGTFKLDNATDRNDVFYLVNKNPAGVTELTLGKDVKIEVTKGNSAVHANGQGGGKVVVNFDGTIVVNRPEGASQFAALQALYNAELNIGEHANVTVNAEFDTYSENNDVVIIMAWGKDNVVNVNGGTFTANTKKAFLQAMQIGDYNSTSPTQFHVNGGTFNLSNDGGKSYAFTAYYANGGQFTVKDCAINGKLESMTLTGDREPLDITLTGGLYPIDPTNILKNKYKATKQENGQYLVEVDPDAMDPLENLFTEFTNGNTAVPEKLVLNQPLTLSSLKDSEGKPCYESQLDNVQTTIVLNDTLTTGKYDWNYGAFRIKNGSDLTIEAGPNGKFINTECIALVSLENNAKLTVKSGEFQSPKGAWQAMFMGGFFSDSYNGEINIEGGVYKFVGADKDHQVPFFSTNKDAVQYNGFIIDPHGYNPAYIKITVTGGTFYNCDPTGYVAEGYRVDAQVIGYDMVYTVVANG